MPNTTALSTPETLAALCGGLDPSHQSALLAFAQFLKSQEAQAALDLVDEKDEIAWEQEFSDAAKAEKFANWARQSVEREEPRPIDPARL